MEQRRLIYHSSLLNFLGSTRESGLIS